MNKIEKLKNKIKNIIENLFYVNEDGGIQIYTDYRERELSSDFIKKILENENPREAFEYEVSDWENNYAYEYGYSELRKDIKKELTEEEKELFDENSDEINEFIEENVYFYYELDDFNNDLNVNIMVDCGNWNYDYSCDNILNWYGQYTKGNIENESSMLWLAKTQGKATQLRRVCKKVFKGFNTTAGLQNKFIKSCIEELENFSSSTGTVTFLVKMSLFQLFDLLELQKNEYDENGKYDPRKNEKSKSYMVIKKDTMCGLFDNWNGGGSLLGIELEKDIKLPIKYAVFSVDGCKMYGRYDIGEVYGMSSSAWKEVLKEIKIVA